MRLSLVLMILVIGQLFLVAIAFSPSVGLSMTCIAAHAAWRQDPNPETERALRQEEAWDTWRPRVVWTLAVVNLVLICSVAKRGKPAA